MLVLFVAVGVGSGGSRHQNMVQPSAQAALGKARNVNACTVRYHS